MVPAYRFPPAQQQQHRRVSQPDVHLAPNLQRGAELSRHSVAFPSSAVGTGRAVLYDESGLTNSIRGERIHEPMRGMRGCSPALPQSGEMF